MSKGKTMTRVELAAKLRAHKPAVLMAAVSPRGEHLRYVKIDKQALIRDLEGSPERKSPAEFSLDIEQSSSLAFLETLDKPEPEAAPTEREEQIADAIESAARLAAKEAA